MTLSQTNFVVVPTDIGLVQRSIIDDSIVVNMHFGGRYKGNRSTFLDFHIASINPRGRLE